MSSNVVGLNGAAVPSADEPCPEVIALLKDWLAKAERGDLKSVLLAGVKRTGTCTAWDGSAGMDECLAAATGLAARVQVAWLQACDVILDEKDSL